MGIEGVPLYEGKVLAAKIDNFVSPPRYGWNAVALPVKPRKP